MELPAIDWSVAVRVGRSLVDPGPELSGSQIAEVVASLRSAAERAEGHVAEVTGMSAAAPAAVRVVDRATWLQAMAESASVVLGQPSPSAPGFRGAVFGGQAGAALAFVAGRILGQFDPFVQPARLLLVAPNIVSLERQLGVDGPDFRLWVCMHEQTHRFQFGHAEWLRGYMLAQISELLNAEEFSFAWAQRRPQGPQDFLGPEQRRIFEQVGAAMSLMEGHAEVMMDRAAETVVPSLAEIRRRFEDRRDRGGWDSWLRRLIGLDIKRAQYRDGAKFCRSVIDATDVATLNRAFESAELLPTMAEIHQPEQWLRRL